MKVTKELAPYKPGLHLLQHHHLDFDGVSASSAKYQFHALGVGGREGGGVKNQFGAKFALALWRF